MAHNEQTDIVPSHSLNTDANEHNSKRTHTIGQRLIFSMKSEEESEDIINFRNDGSLNGTNAEGFEALR